ncbi:MAG: ABC transporter permease [Candidatus Poribacteria bacterium]|nr:ABC transporter permease [Candidatus Poribacteria bacterium]
MKFEWFVALRYLLSRRKQSFISIISIISIAGVGLGVATVILVIAVLDGVEHGIKERFLANEAHVILRLIDNGFYSNYENKIEAIEKVEGVVAASPIVYSQLAVFREGSKQIEDVILIKGIVPEVEDKVTSFTKFVNGSYDFQNDDLIKEARFLNDDITITGGIVLGSRLAQRLIVNEGDVLRLVVNMTEDRFNPGAFIPLIRNFVVIGFYESELTVYDNQTAFIDLETAQKLYQVDGQINFILIRLEDAELAPEMGEQIIAATEFAILEAPTTTTWLETHAALFQALKLEKIATVIIEALIILVAAFNIASTLIMTVMEKTRDVGMLRTLGASRRQVMGIFMIKGSIIGMLGTLAGTALGLYICWLLSTNVMRPSPWIANACIGILSCSVIGIAYRRIDTVSVVFIIFAIIFSINMFITPFLVLSSTMRTVLIILGVIALLIFWIVVLIKSWQKLSSIWKPTFLALGLLAIGFIFFCYIKPISLEELGLSAIYQMNQLPIKVNWFFVCFINMLSFAICWLATIYPAWQASNLKPIEALQYE